MRLFGVVGGTRSQRRAVTITQPFDLVLGTLPLSTGTPDITFVAVARDSIFMAAKRGANYAAFARDTNYTSARGR